MNQNYGYEFELMPAGIVGGPVKLIGKDSTEDLSKNTWSYQVIHLKFNVLHISYTYLYHLLFHFISYSRD